MSYGETTSPEIERVATLCLDAAFRVHRALGPGLLESIYEVCLAYELEKMGLRVRRQMVLPVMYDGVRLDAGLRIDLLVEDVVIIEVKAVEKHHPLFEAQLLTYLKLTHLQLGLLINFNVTLLKDGIKRVVRSVEPKPSPP
jgi:GxxExxY protein